MIQPGDLIRHGELVFLCIGKSDSNYYIFIQYFPLQKIYNMMDLIDRILYMLTHEPKRVRGFNGADYVQRELLEKKKIGSISYWRSEFVDFDSILDIFYERLVVENENLGTNYISLIANLLVFVGDYKNHDKMIKKSKLLRDFIVANLIPHPD